jgi:arsenate reductase
MHPTLAQYINRALLHIDEIDEERRDALEDIAAFVSSKRRVGEAANLIFICTHNSRRSQMGQLWAAVAAAHFGIDRIHAYSGGTEATAFNPHAVRALEKAGFVIEKPGGDNPHHLVTFDEGAPVIECFSKTYDDPFNPTEGFAAIMTCSEADETCPVVLGASLRTPIPYADPKVADGTPEEAVAYDERCRQIATEMLYLFSRVA